MSDQEPLIGKTIAGRYRVTEMIGIGGMGAVYAALQEPLGRTVALKVLKPSFATDDVAVARFKKEAAIVSALSHPNIVTLHDFGETQEGLLYIVMEYLRGSTLSTLLRSRGVMPWQRTIPLLQDVARALSAAHAHGVIHRDLKLDNIMLVQGEGKPDLVKVLDFGVAKTLRTDDGAASLTVTDSSPGTPGYMSPELARGVTTDPRSDFYALGVVWFELLVGRRPFTDKNAMDLFLHQMTQPTPSVQRSAPDLQLPESIDALIQRLLDKDPAGRPADTDALLDALFAIEDAMPTDPRRRRTPSSEAVSATASASLLPRAAESTQPTGAGLFMPTRLGGAPAFTDDGQATMTSLAATSDEHAVTEATLRPPTFVRGPLMGASELGATDLPAVASAPIPQRVRPPVSAVAAAVAVVALVALVALVSMGPDAGRAVEAPELGASARGPLVYQVVVDSGRAERPAPPLAARAARSEFPAEAAEVAATPLPVATAASDVVSAVSLPVPPPVSPPPAPLDIGALRERFVTVGDRLRERMLLPDDVPGYRRLSAEADAALDGGRAADASVTLQELESALASVRLSDSFIKQKLARIEAGFPKDWPRTEAQRTELVNLRTNVHERFGARDLPSANLALNRLWLFSLKAKMAAQAR